MEVIVNMVIEKFSNTLNKIMILMCIILVATGPFLFVIENSELQPLFILGLLLAFAIFAYAPKLKLDKYSPLVLLLFLSLLCFAVKFFWVYSVRIKPAVDYATYFDYAVTLSENFSAPYRYVSLFPHIFGYSWFLSFFMKIFGTGELVVPIINVIFSVIAGVLIFRISYRLIDVRAAVSAYLMWIFCPSQTIFNSLVFADLFYTTMILGFILIITEFKESLSVKKAIFLGVLAAVLLRLINIARPIAIILVIAAVIWLVILKTKNWSISNFRKKWGVFLLITIICYFATGPLWNIYMTARLGEQPAQSAGYSVMVGFNMDSKGTWNQEDSSRLFQYSDMPNATANWAQEQMMEDAKQRIASDEMDFFVLLRDKFKVFSGTDDAAVGYNISVLPNSSKSLSNLSNIFYYMVVCLSVYSVSALNKYSQKSAISIVLLYVIGLILAQMLVEVAGRYHYSIIPMLILIAQYGIFYRIDNKKSDFD